MTAPKSLSTRVGMQNARKHLQAIDQSRAGTIEVSVSVHDVELAVANTVEFLEPGFAREDWQILIGSLDCVSTTGDDHDFGIRLQNRFPGDDTRSVTRSS